MKESRGLINKNVISKNKDRFFYFFLTLFMTPREKLESLTELAGESSKDNKCQVKADIFAGGSFKLCLKDNPSKMGISTSFSSISNWDKEV